LKSRIVSFSARHIVLAIVTLILLLSALAVAVYFARLRRPAFDVSKYGETEKDVTFCTMEATRLGMDVYYPQSGGPWPVLLFVHGGGWEAGDKSDLMLTPTEAGFLVASINYRLYPAFHFPAMIEDVKCAVRYLRAHARQYNLDPERIAVMGHSAGGHLAALAGTADKSAGWDVGPYLAQSSRVQAVVVIAGPADLTQLFPKDVTDLFKNVFLPGDPAAASPVTYASADDPPFLIIQGDSDPVVPVEQAYRLNQALLEAGTSPELLIVQNGGHGLEPINGEISPTRDKIYTDILAFLNKSLHLP
jgi:acetyl esterase/lipase